MIKVVCINNNITDINLNECINGCYKYLTIGKIYEVIIDYGHYKVVDDYGSETYGIYSKELFITLAEWRDKQIDSILK